MRTQLAHNWLTFLTLIKYTTGHFENNLFSYVCVCECTHACIFEKHLL